MIHNYKEFQLMKRKARWYQKRGDLWIPIVEWMKKIYQIYEVRFIQWPIEKIQPILIRHASALLIKEMKCDLEIMNYLCYISKKKEG